MASPTPPSPPRVACPQCQASLKVISLEANQKLTCPQCGATFLTPQLSVNVNRQTHDDDDLLLEGETRPARPIGDARIEKPQVEKSATDRPAAKAKASPSAPNPPQASSPAVPSKPEQGTTHAVPKTHVAPTNRDDLGPLRLDDDLLDSADESPAGPPRPDRAGPAAAGTSPSSSNASSLGSAQPGRVPASLMVYTTGNAESDRKSTRLNSSH